MMTAERWVAYTALKTGARCVVNMQHVALLSPIAEGGTLLRFADGEEYAANEDVAHFLPLRAPV